VLLVTVSEGLENLIKML